MIDVQTQINAVTRTVGGKTFKGGEARTVTVSRTYPTDIKDLWDGCTNAERISRWFLPVEGSLEVGGKYQLVGNASGTVESCDPPHSFAATWEMQGQTSWIEVRLTSAGAGTRFELEHIEHIAHVDEAAEAFWKQFGPGAIGIGWDGMLIGLYLHVTTGAANDADEFQAWALSPEGIEFHTLSSERWAQASIDFGTDPDEARATQEASTAFYTTPPEA